MLLSELKSGGETFQVGIGEIRNTSRLEASELIRIAREESTDVQALQLLAAENIAGAIHLLSAVQNALNAWTGKYAISKTLDVEIILYSSAQNQINRALKTMGLQGTPESVAVVIVGDTSDIVHATDQRLVSRIGPEAEPMFSASEPRVQQIMSLFNITDDEIRSLVTGDSLQDRLEALGRCVASRISTVAIDT